VDLMNAAEVRSVLAEGLPDYQAGTVTLLDEGEDNRAFEVDGALVVRFALAPDPAAIDREARLLNAVAAVVPVPVPVPAFVLAERGCLAYRKLPGIPLLDLPQRRDHAESLVAQLSGLLAVLHAIPPESMARLAAVDDQPMTQWLAEAGAFYPAVASRLPARFRPRVKAFLAADPPSRGHARVFTHNDLGAEHVLVDAATWTVTGILDWTDAALTDPAYDHGLLLRDLGPAALARLASDVRERAVFYARCSVLEELAYALESGKQKYAANALSALPWLFGQVESR
jgi:aminoglycoside phosphotransferase (APT) family kinase protein